MLFGSEVIDRNKDEEWIKKESQLLHGCDPSVASSSKYSGTRSGARPGLHSELFLLASDSVWRYLRNLKVEDMLLHKLCNAF
jgi:hypothetical protein